MKLTFVACGSIKADATKSLMFNGEKTTKSTSLGENVVTSKFFFKVPADAEVKFTKDQVVDVSEDEFNIVPIDGVAHMIWAK